MSPQERHPLDERFRQVLHQAEATPPPAVWAAVKQANTSAKRKGGWWRWSTLSLALLLFSGATAIYFMLRQPGIMDERRVRTPIEAGLPDEPRTARSNGTSNLSGTITEEFISTSVPLARGLDVNGPTPGYIGSGTGETAGDSGPLNISQLETPRAKGHSLGGSSARSLPKDTSTAQNSADGRSTFQDVRSASPNSSYSLLSSTGVEVTPMAIRDVIPSAPERHRSPIYAPKPPTYLLPHGEWWVAPVLGVHALSNQWRGTDDRLVGALENATGGTSTLGYGILAGRQWRNGFVLSGGLMTERTESQLHYRDQLVQVDQEITTYLITLNTQVFVSDVDTVTTITTEDRSTSGSLRRTAWRVPLDLRWRWALGRWQLGVHGGLAFERTSAQGASLVVADGEGRLMAADPGVAELRGRYPTALLGSVGVELGWSLNERWVIWMNPLYMTGMTALDPTSSAYTMPRRWGLQFSLAHHFIPSRTK